MATMTTPRNKSFCSVSEAAEVLGCTEQHVRYLIRHDKVKAERFSSLVWLVNVSSLKKYARREINVGRPRKKKSECAVDSLRDRE
jgi:predicted transcriptional regulator